MSKIDEDWTTLHNLAKSRSRMFVSDPKLREFLQRRLALCSGRWSWLKKRWTGRGGSLPGMG
jgi:hypothetical protein